MKCHLTQINLEFLLCFNSSIVKCSRNKDTELLKCKDCSTDTFDAMVCQACRRSCHQSHNVSSISERMGCCSCFHINPDEQSDEEEKKSNIKIVPNVKLSGLASSRAICERRQGSVLYPTEINIYI